MTNALAYRDPEAAGPEAVAADTDASGAATPTAAPQSAIFDLAHEEPPIDMLACLRRISEETGRKPLQVAKELLQLSTGPGRLSFADYIAYRLFDDAFVGAVDKTAFIGQRRNQDLMMEINFRHEWICMAQDKVAGASYLAAYGLPVAPISAIYAPAMQAGRGNLLRSREALCEFLSHPAHYPMFGKPVAGFQSLGSIGLLAFDAETQLVTTPVATIPLETLVDEIVCRFERGYLFQNLLTTHSALRPAIGSGLGTARILTVKTDGAPRVFAAAWKMIGGTNIADNYWRPGNILASLDLDSGRVRRAVTGSGFGLKTLDVHPTTGSTLANLQLPNWAAMKDLAIEGHKTLRDVGLIGWDIGSTDDGPVIVEANVMPDLVLVQAANGEGLYNSEFTDILAHQRRGAADHRRAMKATLVRP